MIDKLKVYLLLFPSLVFAQARSGRGEDWWLYDDYSSSGDGAWWFIFLIGFWGIIFLITAIRTLIEYAIEAFSEKSEPPPEKMVFDEPEIPPEKIDISGHINSLKETLKSFFYGACFLGFLIFIFYLLVRIDIQVPIYLEYLGRLIMMLFWLAAVRYIFFLSKTNEDIINFFKKPLGILIAILIISFVTLMVFD